MANDPAKRPTARALEDMLAMVRLDDADAAGRAPAPRPVPTPRPAGDDGPPTVHLKQRSAIANFIQQLFGR